MSSFARNSPSSTRQRRAVETIEGPVMVVAGPGTGKTQTVSMRVANILQKTQMRPATSSAYLLGERRHGDARPTAFADRPDAYGVTVRTIHGFCQDVITDHPVLFDEWSAAQQISDLERYRE